jgi:uncharacterized protein
MRTILITAALAATTLLAPAQAQSKKDLINKILTLQKPQYEQFGNVLAQAPLQQMLPQVGQVLRARVPEDKREAAGKAVDAEVRKFLDEVSPTLRASSVKHAQSLVSAKLEAGFNEAELKQIIGYLESPVVKRYGQLGPEVQPALAQKVTQEQRSLIESKAKALDQKLADILGLRNAAEPPQKPASKP